MSRIYLINIQIFGPEIISRKDQKSNRGSGSPIFIKTIKLKNLGNNTNDGCGIQAQNNTFNTGFNQAGGGVFALEWDREKFIRVWNFVRPNIPDDIAQVCL